nr:MFS transporter [Solimicrobium silvestre]
MPHAASSSKNSAMHSRSLNKSDVKVLSLASLGGALEYYDFIIFIFFASVFSGQFFPADLSPFWKTLNTYGAFAIAYFMRPIGGVIMAHFGDLVGRKRMFTLSIVLMALPTLCIGFLPTFEHIGYAAPILLLLMRMLQGIAIGGEIPGAWVFVSEHVPAKRIGLANGMVTSGLTLGILLGSLMALLINSTFSKSDIAEYAWRIPFIVGGLLGFVTVYLRRYLHETPVFKEMQERKALNQGLPIAAVIKDHKPAILISVLATWLLTAGIVVIILFAPELMKSDIFNVPAKVALTMQSFTIVALALGCITTGQLCDKFGVGKTFIVMCSALAISSSVFYHSIGHVDYPTLTVMYAITGFFVGIVGGVPYIMVHAFPAKIRFSGLSFSYNLSYAIFGGLTPLFLGIVNKINPLSASYYVVFLSIMGVFCGIYLLKDSAKK